MYGSSFRVGAVAPLLALPVLSLAVAGPAAAAPGGASGSVAAAGLSSAATSTGSAHLRDVQQRLYWLGMAPGPRTGTYTAATTKAIRRFQKKFGLPVVGVAGPRTTALLKKLTPRGSAIDPRCKAAGKVICADKSQRLLRVFSNGKLLKTTDARFGGPGMATREGSFKVYRKSRHHVSSLYGSKMPYAMFFSGGQAVHYSSDFAARGYNGSSHGCVNVRNPSTIAWLFGWAPVGTRVVVYRSV